MSYTVKKLADLAGVSVRTLHFYDEVGLLKPDRIKNNGYRYYEEKELLKLQQILFFRELDFSTKEIKKILSSQNFDMTVALRDQRKLIELKKKRLDGLVKTIDKTIKKINKKITMDDKDLYGSFTKEEMDEFAKEAKMRWGHTSAYKESEKRVKNMTKDELARIEKETDLLMKDIANNMDKGARSEKVHELIDKHYNNLRNFYEPNLEMYRGLADMFVNDKRFSAYFEKYAKGLTKFMHEAMIAYCDAREGK